MKTSKQKRFAAAFAGMLCISCLTTPFSAAAEDTDITGENDTIAAAEEMPLNTAVSGEISTKGDVDYYKITLPEDGTLQISLTAGWVSDFGDSYCITLYDADGTEISKDDYIHSNTPFPADGRTAGVYYLSLPITPTIRPPALTPSLQTSPRKASGKQTAPMNWNPMTVSTQPVPLRFPPPARVFSTITRIPTTMPSLPTSPESSLLPSGTICRAAILWDGVCFSTILTGNKSAKPA